MPELSRFFGIVVMMYSEKDNVHHLPHIHVRSGDDKAEISLEGDVLAGTLPTKKLRMVQVWIDIHHDELLENWALLSEGRKHFAIKPLE